MTLDSLFEMVGEASGCGAAGGFSGLSLSDEKMLDIRILTVFM